MRCAHSADVLLKGRNISEYRASQTHAWFPLSFRRPFLTQIGPINGAEDCCKSRSLLTPTGRASNTALLGFQSSNTKRCMFHQALRAAVVFLLGLQSSNSKHCIFHQVWSAVFVLLLGLQSTNSKHCIFHQVLCAAVVLLLGFPHQTQSTAFSIKSCVRLLSFYWGSHIKLGALHFPSGLACGCCPFVGAPVNKFKALHFPSSLLCGWCPFVCGEGVLVPPSF